MLTRVEISRSALLQNTAIFRALRPESAFMAVVKSNAYGHGLEEVVQILSGSVDWFGVNSLGEASRIRALDRSTPILVMGELDGDDLSLLAEANSGEGRVDAVFSTLDGLRRHESLGFPAALHLKVDTGMGRLGADGEDLRTVFQGLGEREKAPWAGIMTHFANVEDVTNQDYGLSQLNKFEQAWREARSYQGARGVLRHAAASAPALLLPESCLDVIRVGIALYGLWPSSLTKISLHASLGSIPEFQPALKWTTQIVHIKTVPENSYIGYGCTYRTQGETRLAVLPAGYFEGYERALSNRSHALIRGRRARLLGRVCMNMIMVDVTHIPEASLGDEAVLIGRSGAEEVSADELADLTSTINYEVVARIQGDLPRVIVP